MRYLLRALAPLAAITMVAAPARAQASYYTQGYFTSPGFAPCDQAAPPPGSHTDTSCSGGGLTLQFFGTTASNIASGSVGSLGQFLLTGSGEIALPPGLIMFHILLNQTTPTNGTGAFVGSIDGTVSTLNGQNSSTLIFTPNEFVNIPPTMYQLIYDDVGPAAGVGLAIPYNDVRGVNMLVTSTTATPEPASIALVATGMIGLGGFARRRRKNAQTVA
jgi:hypothetical protein